MSQPPGIDFTAGLEATGNDEDLYQRLLETFFVAHRSDAALLRQAIADDDAGTARAVAPGTPLSPESVWRARAALHWSLASFAAEGGSAYRRRVSRKPDV